MLFTGCVSLFINVIGIPVVLFTLVKWAQNHDVLNQRRFLQVSARGSGAASRHRWWWPKTRKRRASAHQADPNISPEGGRVRCITSPVSQCLP
jgi:hypothetical protein